MARPKKDSGKDNCDNKRTFITINAVLSYCG